MNILSTQEYSQIAQPTKKCLKGVQKTSSSLVLKIASSVGVSKDSIFGHHILRLMSVRLSTRKVDNILFWHLFYGHRKNGGGIEDEE